MICFEVRVNGDVVGVAGLADILRLNAVVEWNRFRNSLELKVGGPAGTIPEAGRPRITESVCWIDRPLAVGDEVTVKVVDLPSAPPPTFRLPHVPSDPAS